MLYKLWHRAQAAFHGVKDNSHVISEVLELLKFRSGETQNIGCGRHDLNMMQYGTVQLHNQQRCPLVQYSVPHASCTVF
jgi:3-deoxy-D-manno-octulosonate 8-phosphate phosphatase KdsC-like HAD superfamily phosphatase